MAKKQTRRSISVSRSTYERLKAFCETNGTSMSQFVETRVGAFLSEPGHPLPPSAAAPRPKAPLQAQPTRPPEASREVRSPLPPAPAPIARPTTMSHAPVSPPKPPPAAPKHTAETIFTF